MKLKVDPEKSPNPENRGQKNREDSARCQEQLGQFQTDTCDQNVIGIQEGKKVGELIPIFGKQVQQMQFFKKHTKKSQPGLYNKLQTTKK